MSTGAAGAAVTPSYNQSPTADNLLICWAVTDSTSVNFTTPTGWSAVNVRQVATIFYKVAVGGDAQPTIAAIPGNVISAQLAEFAGGALGNPLDQGAKNSSSVSPIAVTATAADATPGELLVYCGGAIYTTAATKTLTHTLNNGATNHDTQNNSISTTLHYSFGWAVTTGNSSADSDSFAFTTTKINAGSVQIASFQLAPPLMLDVPPLFLP